MAINTDPSSRLANFRFAGVPADATPFNAANGTDISDTTAQAIKAAVTGKRHWITRITLTNKTASETPIVVIQDDTGTPVVILTARLGGLAAADSQRDFVFDPPIEVASGKAINGKATTATGDVVATVGGFVES
jgi:hypothetical protein